MHQRQHAGQAAATRVKRLLNGLRLFIDVTGL
jgi:hypothetical protein